MKTRATRLRNDIGWCDATANAVLGCAKVSAGCRNCYAEHTPPARVLRAAGQETWGPNAVRHENATFLQKVERLNKSFICGKCRKLYDSARHQFGQPCNDENPFSVCDGALRRIRLFADSTSDWLDPAWPGSARLRLAEAVRQFQNIDFQLLTKRIELYHLAVQQLRDMGFGELDLGNVWLGVSVEDQENAHKRIHQLLRISAALHWVSAEPLLQYVDLRPWLKRGTTYALDWVVVGGESGPHRRDCGAEAIEKTAHHCVEARVPVWIKQDCHLRPGQQGRLPDEVWRIKEVPH